MGARLRNYFLTGLVVAGPLAITGWLIWAFVTWVDDLVRPLIPEMYRPETYLPWRIPGSGLVIALFALTLLGFLTANLVGRSLVQLGDHLIDRMPIVRPIYKTVKQVFQMLFSKSGTSFRKVGLVEFPAPGMWSLVFLSQPPSPEVASRLPDGDDQISVFLPCTPNPTTGFYFYVPRKHIIELEIPVEAGGDPDHVGGHDPAGRGPTCRKPRTGSPRWRPPRALRSRRVKPPRSTRSKISGTRLPFENLYPGSFA